MLSEADELLAELSERGVRLTASADGGLTCQAPAGVLTPDLRRRIAGHKPALIARLEQGDGLPRGVPRTVEGVPLDAIEAGVFDQAVRRGELVIEPWLPVHSPVPKAYRLWCAANGVEHREREVKLWA